MQVHPLLTDKERDTIHKLFEELPPILVEIRFPRMGTSSDWYLLDDETQLEQILATLGPNVVVRLNSVWDVDTTKNATILNR